MSRIVLRFIRSSGFVPTAICWVTNSCWSHVEALWEEDGKPQGWVGAHALGGFQIRPLDYCRPVEERQYSLKVTPDQFAMWRAGVRGTLGKRYDYLDILGQLLRKRKWHNPAGVICSGSQIELAHGAGIQLLNVLPGFYYLVTPEMLHLSPLLIGKCIYHGGTAVTPKPR